MIALNEKGEPCKPGEKVAELILGDPLGEGAARLSQSDPSRMPTLQPAAQLDAADREPGEDEQRHDHDDRT